MFTQTTATNPGDVALGMLGLALKLYSALTLVTLHSSPFHTRTIISLGWFLSSQLCSSISTASQHCWEPLGQASTIPQKWCQDHNKHPWLVGVSHLFSQVCMCVKWDQSTTKYPTLKWMAWDYLAIQGSVTPSKHAFSSGGITGCPCWNKLKPNIFEGLQLLKSAYWNGHISATTQAGCHTEDLIKFIDSSSEGKDEVD
jgi:hypothetical protein